MEARRCAARDDNAPQLNSALDGQRTLSEVKMRRGSQSLLALAVVIGRPLRRQSFGDRGHDSWDWLLEYGARRQSSNPRSDIP